MLTRFRKEYGEQNEKGIYLMPYEDPDDLIQSEIRRSDHDCNNTYQQILLMN